MPLLSERLAAGRPLLADGATGTNLFDMGLVSGDAPELWNVDRPDRTRALHEGFVEAGADIILTNTFGANAMRLKLHDAQDRVREINAAGARLAREVAERSERAVVVAGSVGPTGELFEPMGELTHDAARDAFREQMEGLKEGGADVAWIETMSSVEEIAAACEAARAVGLEYVFTASFDTAGMTMMGVDPAALVALAEGMDPPPVAVGANCGVGAPDLLASLRRMTQGAVPVGVVAKANCGVPRVEGENVVYSGTPEQMASYARLAVDLGARIVGGCCGTTAEHLRAMREALDGHEPGERPSLATIAETVGPYVNAVGDRPTAAASNRRGGRRRRS